MEEFITGAICMASVVVALFFLKFWRKTGDRLFGMFAVAFLLLGITRFGLAFSQMSRVLANEIAEGHTHWYWVRLTAFLLILIAIIDKNRR
jgi:Family of unknown function (DUF5985)